MLYGLTESQVQRIASMLDAYEREPFDLRRGPRRASGGGTPGKSGVFGRIVSCSRTSGVATVQLFTNYIYASGSSNTADGDTVEAINGVEAWHRVDDDVVLLPLANATPAYMIVDKLKGFAWENPASYIHDDYTLDIDTDICPGLS